VRVLVTRPAGPGAEALAEPLEALGAECVRFPTVELVDPPDKRPLLASARALADVDWLLLTSANAVDRLASAMRDVGTAGLPSTVRIACVGPITARPSPDRLGRGPDLVPERRFRGAAMAEQLAAAGLAGSRVVYPRASAAPATLKTTLTAAGATVDDPVAYTTACPRVDAAPLAERLAAGELQVATFASGSSVSNLASLLGADRIPDLLGRTAVACLGPVTAAEAVRHGLEVAIQPALSTAPALVEAIRLRFG